MKKARVLTGIYKNIVGDILNHDKDPNLAQVHSEKLQAHVTVDRGLLQHLDPITYKPLPKTVAFIDPAAATKAAAAASAAVAAIDTNPDPETPQEKIEREERERLEETERLVRQTDLENLMHTADQQLIQIHHQISDRKHPIYNPLEIKKINETLEEMNLDLGMEALESMLALIRLSDDTDHGRKGDLDKTANEIHFGGKKYEGMHHSPIVTEWIDKFSNVLRNMLHKCSLATMFHEMKEAVDHIYLWYLKMTIGNKECTLFFHRIQGLQNRKTLSTTCMDYFRLCAARNHGYTMVDTTVELKNKRKEKDEESKESKEQGDDSEVSGSDSDDENFLFKKEKEKKKKKKKPSD